ncbi:hypothetical protein E2C01_020866 [Portunus trituberculatus]|uniref:Uncharacterized protein n=1 Tax=Portunus trituberculatus TaxID=210409 RepID=A0A5B7E3G1_PORTR|nr:hypothetical protein [Portunus trituberculatus]
MTNSEKECMAEDTKEDAKLLLLLGATQKRKTKGLKLVTMMASPRLQGGHANRYSDGVNLPLKILNFTAAQLGRACWSLPPYTQSIPPHSEPQHLPVILMWWSCSSRDYGPSRGTAAIRF